MADPRLSIIIPVYNQRQYLAEALDSVLDQDYRDTEIIVVDDGSTDGSGDVAEGYKGVRLIRKKNAGQGAALNMGISQARGELLGFLDADDKWAAQSLSLRVAKLDENPEVDMIHGMLLEFVSPELAAKGLIFRRADGRPVSDVVLGATLIRSASWRKVGPLDEVLTLGAAIEWLARARHLGLKAYFLDQVVLHRRVHDANSSLTKAEFTTDYVKLVKRVLDRKRAMAEGQGTTDNPTLAGADNQEPDD